MKKIILLIIFTLIIPIVSKSESTIYNSESLIIHKITDNLYQHISFLNTESWGKVECNGIIYISKNEAIVFDTTPDDSSSSELIEFIENELKVKVSYLVINHFHNDCLGGVNSFIKKDVKIICNKITLELVKKDKVKFDAITFDDEYIIDIDNGKVINKYFGEGHTKDNIISYITTEKLMFGGCLIKEIGAGRGNLADANVNEWSKTVSKIKLSYPDVQYIIPGHGKYGGVELLEYTIKLFEKE